MLSRDVVMALSQTVYCSTHTRSLRYLLGVYIDNPSLQQVYTEKTPVSCSKSHLILLINMAVHVLTCYQQLPKISKFFNTRVIRCRTSATV